MCLGTYIVSFRYPWCRKASPFGAEIYGTWTTPSGANETGNNSKRCMSSRCLQAEEYVTQCRTLAILPWAMMWYTAFISGASGRSWVTLPETARTAS